ncbi:MAG: aspartate aminotransferase family protein [Alphaproteobacteria bacterium]|nr:aspartate aminotransferase family protein [Alphaproteobacteria bacterium]MBV9964866.1 aspartate aminotransferase family protein [Alphaproteobacteria bacterium]
MIPAVMPTYGRWDVAAERGEGCYLHASDGRKFLDFTSGIAVTSLGHCHPHLIEAVTQQAQKLWHTSNMFQIPGQQRLAQRLVANSFADTVFFNNSGAEAVELSLKVARKYQSETGHPERYRVIGCHGSFHGRSFATLAAAGAEAYLKGFGPVMDGFDHVAFNNLNEMRAAVTEQTAAILVEPVQGEGGVRAPSRDYLKGLRDICDEFGLVLVYDEVQSGMGRTGKLFAHEWAGVPPDVMAVAKALGNGLPVGACLATEKAAVGMVAGSHGSTFGGNPLAMAAGNAVLDVMLEPGFFERTQRMARLLWGKLEGLVGAYPKLFGELRGSGHLLGIRCQPNLTAGDFVAKLRAEGLLCLTAGDNVLRILPPLVAGEREIDEALGIMHKVAKGWPAS